MRRLLTALALLLLAPLAHAQFGDTDPVTWTVSAAPTSAEPGQTVTVSLSATIGGDWRMYAMDSPVGRPLSVRFESSDALAAVGPVQQPQPREGFDRVVEEDYTYFAEAVQLTRLYRVAADAPGGDAAIRGAVTYMVCNDDLCLPPKDHPFRLTVAVEGAPAVAEAPPPRDEDEDAEPEEDEPVALAEPPAAAPPAQAEPEIATPFEPQEERSGGLWAFLLLAVGAGLAALLTPCVFPMIPLTVSYFLHQAGDRRKAARMAGLYGLAIVGLFTGLGIAMALLVGAAGPQLIAANPWVNLFIGLVLVVFGFSLLGFFELRMPSGLLNVVNRQGDERGGIIGILFMGFTLVLVSFSCTVPFVGGLLAATVQGGWVEPVLGMVVFSSVFAAPFVVFAAFPNALNRLPKSGSWMGALKGTLGFIEIAAALKFLSNADLVWGLGVLPRPLAIALMIVIFALAGFYLIGKLHLKSPEAEVAVAPQPVGGLRLLTAIGFFGLAFYLVPGLLGAPLGGLDAFLPPRLATDVSLTALAGPGGGPERGGEFGWHQTREAAFDEARRTGRPVFIDFTGYTCTNCRHMEATVLSRPEIAERIDRHFVPLQLWTDDGVQGPELQRYQLQLTGRIALPTYAVVHPDGALVSQLSGVTSAEKFAAFLDDGTERYLRSDALALR